MKVLSGQRPPLAPEEVYVVRVDANSVEIEWEPIYVKAPKTVDGYWVRICQDSLLLVANSTHIPFLSINFPQRDNLAIPQNDNQALPFTTKEITNKHAIINNKKTHHCDDHSLLSSTTAVQI